MDQGWVPNPDPWIKVGHPSLMHGSRLAFSGRDRNIDPFVVTAEFVLRDQYRQTGEEPQDQSPRDTSIPTSLHTTARQRTAVERASPTPPLLPSTVLPKHRHPTPPPSHTSPPHSANPPKHRLPTPPILPHTTSPLQGEPLMHKASNHKGAGEDACCSADVLRLSDLALPSPTCIHGSRLDPRP